MNYPTESDRLVLLIGMAAIVLSLFARQPILALAAAGFCGAFMIYKGGINDSTF